MYCGEKVRLRAYKEEDIPLATKFVNDSELKKLLVTNNKRWTETQFNSKNNK